MIHIGEIYHVELTDGTILENMTLTKIGEHYMTWVGETEQYIPYRDIKMIIEPKKTTNEQQRNDKKVQDDNKDRNRQSTDGIP